MNHPKPLIRGSRIEIISPSGAMSDELIDKGAEQLGALGYQVTIAQHAKSKFGRFAGTARQRTEDFLQTFRNENVDAIWCSRGGYGCAHLLEALEKETNKQISPKWLIGYSDITALHAYLNNRGFQSLHAPMLKHLAEEGNDTAITYTQKILSGEYPRYTIDAHPLNKLGKATATLRGGNLSVLLSLRGTPFDLPADTDIILFIEDIAEQPYHIERMLYNLKLGGVLSRIKGLIVGQFSDCPKDTSMPGSIYELISNLMYEYNIPVCFNFPVGHVKENYPLICGAKTQLKINENGATLSFL
ncbi:MAG: S66 peptidase family protein [Tannerellaceae bacterium]